MSPVELELAKSPSVLRTDSEDAPALGMSFAEKDGGLLITPELDEAVAQCRAEVKRIAQDCRSGNRKYRDIGFDIENNQGNTLYGLFVTELYMVADVRRVDKVFDKPLFFDGSCTMSNDIVQGGAGDCWFLSALATVSSSKRLIEKLCVERDEEVGVYGFIFFRDNRWEPVIVDDLLYTRIPRYEELKINEQNLYHYKKELYEKVARKGGKSLFFARSESSGDTWVPLIEKAYAKLHGSYSSLGSGQEWDALEDLTGGVATVVLNKDILDTDRFWNEELSRANRDRLFGCSFNNLSGERNGKADTDVQGLFGAHSYSVLRAVEVKGRRFVMLRNPWGKSEWTGRWSDGSKEWTREWVRAMPLLGHTFGNDGQFMMEYSDWLDCFSFISRVVLFDSSWAMCSEWLRVQAPPLPAAWSYGLVSFKITVSGATPAIIVLSKLNSRYYRDFSAQTRWYLDFSVVREGEKEVLAQPHHSQNSSRSVSLELELEAGTYFVYVRLDRDIVDTGDLAWPETVEDWRSERLCKAMERRAQSQSIASIIPPRRFTYYLYRDHPNFLRDNLSTLIMQENEDTEAKKTNAPTESSSDGPNDSRPDILTTSSTPSNPTPIVPPPPLTILTPPTSPYTTAPSSPLNTTHSPPPPLPATKTEENPPDVPKGTDSETPKAPEPDRVRVPYDDRNTLFLGLRLYTRHGVRGVVEGRLGDEAVNAPRTGAAAGGTGIETRTEVK
ncbi:hypothetical protein DFP72DRAFT_806477 [Ephemerocybe angulata]|uniref:Calpain catalytic domain-containing protein n=1 Tax=Ephemerocybe angulata TaxID=980116 RepID=A0A8H6I7U3_9AGAR|nr:hypothetical protein DFP72DRAFT_806477 [Tulosesus angulatus]